VTFETLAAIFAIAVPVLSYAGTWAANRVHLSYLRRDVDECRRSVRRAHWRLDEIQAPPAPSVD